MLYTTTRSHNDTFTAHRTLMHNRGPDGGLFVPFRIPVFSEDEILLLGQRSFNQILADTLNLFFNTHLTAYDVTFTMGRAPVRIQQLGQKILMTECWHNTDWDFAGMIRDLSKLILADKKEEPSYTGWVGIGIRIAVLFGVFGELIRTGVAGPGNNIDVALVCGDFSGVMSCWYAKKMGIPIGNIVCCCNENGNVWNFICHGQLRTDTVARRTAIPEGDIVIPEGLERLISVYGGQEEVQRYVNSIHSGTTYYVEESFLKRIRNGIYVTVSSETRVMSTIPNVFVTHNYLLEPCSALAYAGLQDYRSRTGEMRTALVMMEKSPQLNSDVVAEALGITPDQMKL